MRKQALASPKAGRRAPTLLLGLLLYAFCAALLLTVAGAIIRGYRWRVRGVEPPASSASQTLPDKPWGVNVSLEQYDEAEARHVLDMIHQAGFRWIRQRFPWEAMEAEPGDYRWEPWDRLVELISRQGLELIAVLDGSPAWARSPADADNPLAPPQEPAPFARWAGQLAARYRGRIAAYQIWDEPNIWPHWGHRPPNPAAYTRLLAATYEAIKEATPDAVVLSAGLAPTTETSGRNLSDIVFLRGMYDAGATPFFDVLGAKPYGFWSGPEDRRVAEDVLNFSRVILLREEMRRRGDASKPIWAVELGWNALPTDWAGRQPPWGSDDATKQADRTLRALQRARAEWPWLAVICLRHFQPNAPPDDPLWGFALVDRDLTPRLLYYEVKSFLASPASDPPPYKPRTRSLLISLSILAAGLAVVIWRGAVCFRSLPWLTWWRQAETAFASLPSWAQLMCLVGAIVLYFLSPWLGPAFLGLWATLVLAYWRLDLALLCTAFAIPLRTLSRPVGHLAFSLIETLALICIGAWVLQWAKMLLDGAYRTARPISSRGFDWRGMDGAWLLFLLIAAASLLFARYKEVSLREFRTVVLEPALFYLLLVHAADREPGPHPRPTLLECPQELLSHCFALFLADAFVLAGAALAVHGLWQYFSGHDVIIAEGVRRVRGIYSSPNNLSLILGRILPLAVALALESEARWRRALHAGAAFLILPCLFLTFSRGAWLLGWPAALLFLAAMRGRKTFLLAIALVLLSVALLLPFAGTTRIASLLDTRSGTTLFRLSLWRSALAMIRDHPVTGVGLDNFLYYYSAYILPEAAAEPNLSHPHNIVLDFWLRLGIGGLVALAWMLISFFRAALRVFANQGDRRALALGLMASVVACLAHGLVDHSYFLPELAFAFALATGILSRLNSELT